MKPLLLISFVLLLASCQKPPRDNPWDELAGLDPQSWAPKNLKISDSIIGHPVLSWDYNADKRIQGFQIDRRKGDEQWIDNYAILNATTLTFTDTITPDNQSTYTYRVKSFAGNIYSRAAEINIVAVLPAPQSFSVSSISDVSFHITWQYNHSGHDGFILERSIAEGSMKLLDTLSPDVRQFSDSSYYKSKAPINFQYRIFTFLNTRHSAFAELNTDFVLPPPTLVAVTKNNITSVTLSWQDNSQGEEGFFVEMNINDGVWWLPVDLTQAPSMTIDNLPANSNLSFRVSAFYQGLFSSKTSISTNTFIPSPENVTLNIHNGSSLMVNWSYNTTGHQGFSIDRKCGNDPWQTNFAILGVQTSSWLDVTVYPDSSLTYQYRISAFVLDESSPEVVVELQPFKPPYVMEGLIAWWPFSGDFSDESGNYYHLANNGATFTKDRFNESMNAAYFNGSSWLQAPPNNLQFSSGITISLWAKLENSSNPHFLISKGQDNQNGHFHIQFSESLNKFACQLNAIGSDNSVFSFEYPSPHSDWYHVIFTYDNEIERIYINGVLNDSNPYSQQIANLTAKILIGKHISPAFPYFTLGSLDDIGIWNRALSPSEIQRIFEMD